MKPTHSKKSVFDEGPLDLYLKEISNYPLLSREDESELAKKIEDTVGVYKVRAAMALEQMQKEKVS